MRIVAIIVGIILLIAGIWVTVGNGSVETTDTLVKIGDASIKSTHDTAIPTWAGIAGIVVGALLVLGTLFTGRKGK